MQRPRAMTKGILWLTLPDQRPPVAPLHANQANHLHVTLQFGVEYTEEIAELIGKEVGVTAVANCSNGRIQALKINLPEEVLSMCKNPVPHMTISSEDGVKPVESNNMLSSDHSCTVVDIPLSLRFDFFHFDRS